MLQVHLSAGHLQAKFGGRLHPPCSQLWPVAFLTVWKGGDQAFPLLLYLAAIFCFAATVEEHKRPQLSWMGCLRSSSNCNVHLWLHSKQLPTTLTHKLHNLPSPTFLQPQEVGCCQFHKAHSPLSLSKLHLICRGRGKSPDILKKTIPGFFFFLIIILILPNKTES